VFPAKTLSVDPRSGKVRRHHVGERVLQMAMRQAVVRAGLAKPASIHTLIKRFSYQRSYFVGMLFKNQKGAAGVPCR
jgi:hypothetical protein